MKRIFVTLAVFIAMAAAASPGIAHTGHLEHDSGVASVTPSGTDETDRAEDSGESADVSGGLVIVMFAVAGAGLLAAVVYRLRRSSIE